MLQITVLDYLDISQSQTNSAENKLETTGMKNGNALKFMK